MRTLVPATHLQPDWDQVIKRANLAQSTKVKYRRALAAYLATGASITDPDALCHYVESLSSSGRAFLKAAVRLITEELANTLKGQVTPENLDQIQAALLRIEALQNSVEAPAPKGSAAPAIWPSLDEVEALLTTRNGDLAGRRDRLAGDWVRVIAQLPQDDIKPANERPQGQCILAIAEYLHDTPPSADTTCVYQIISHHVVVNFRRKTWEDNLGETQYSRIWTTDNTQHRASYKLIVRTVKFLGKRKGNGGAPVSESSARWLAKARNMMGVGLLVIIAISSFGLRQSLPAGVVT